MAITYPLSLPNVKGIKSFTMHSIQIVGRAESPFTRQGQTQPYSGDGWAIDVTLPAMKRADAEAWNCFLLSLRGQAGTFYLGDPSDTSARGPAGGTPKMNGSGNTRGVSTIATKGWAPSVTGILLFGDFIQLGNYLHKVLVSANSDGSGNSILEIFPSLRENNPDNTTIITSGCKGIWRLAQNDNVIWTETGASIYDIAFQAVEAL